MNLILTISPQYTRGHTILLAHNTLAQGCNTGKQKEFTERKVGR
jgi:hypothetical protein